MMTSVSAPSNVHVSIISPVTCPDQVLVSQGGTSSAVMNYVQEDRIQNSAKLINMKNLVQDEKLVVATLATLQSGGPSDIIKEELKYIIQSRRVAEGKGELKVDFSPPEKNELTPQDVERREKRRERNRLAAQRSRERGKRKMDELMHEIEQLQSKNAELEHMFDGLSKERDRLKRALLDHLSLCPSYEEPLNLSLKDT
ncbi:cyclic AMP-dependent transcription factor ATF-3-like isoform X2 [Haliotis rubra]|uniref:cyclic AMP-dependent transcription factor ATF-3-like isoform X2 n=1 Tax=Haliotis rubra TaxID=36100 RepID=UPI001EE5D802|nr:cyclic AMP-dependent transcription factor ATF-3-like isoform X2 [Haliotis rubra]